jgi:hypothetical protein
VRSHYEYDTLRMTGAVNIPLTNDTYKEEDKLWRANEKPMAFYYGGLSCDTPSHLAQNICRRRHRRCRRVAARHGPLPSLQGRNRSNGHHRRPDGVACRWQPHPDSGPDRGLHRDPRRITAQHGIAGPQLATLMAGVILLLMGWAKLGGVIKYIPDPVVVGFTVGIAVIIWVGKDFFTEDQHVLGEPAFVTRLHTNNAQPKHFFDGSAVPS